MYAAVAGQSKGRLDMQTLFSSLGKRKNLYFDRPGVASTKLYMLLTQLHPLVLADKYLI